MAFKPLLATRDRRALLEEWRRKNANKAGRKNALERSEVNKSESVTTQTTAGTTPVKTVVGGATLGVKYDYASMRGKENDGTRGEMNVENDGSFVTPRSKTSEARVGTMGNERRGAGEQASTSETTTPSTGKRSTFFSLSGARKSTNGVGGATTIDLMPSPAVRARLKAVETEKEALQALATKLRESSEAALEEAYSKRSEAEERAKSMSERLQKMESDRASLQADMAAVRAQAQALAKAKEEHMRALRKEKRAAEAAAKALEQAKEDANTAVQEREFTIANQAAILEELDDELDRAERSREKAELVAAEKDKLLKQLRAQLDEAKHELEMATKHQTSKQNVDTGGVRASQEKLLQLAAARQEAEADAARARQEAKSLAVEVEARRAELETVQCELEKCLQEERMERQRAEEAYSEVQLERNTLEVLVEKRTLEKIALEERLEAVTEEAEFLRSEMKERDEMLREGNQLVEAKETELEQAVTYVLHIQEQLEQMQASGGGDNTEVAERIKELQIKHEALRMEKQKILEDMHTEIVERDALLSASKKSLESKEAELEALRAEYSTRTTELGPLEIELQGLRERVYSYKFELEEKNAQLAANDALVKQMMSAEKRQTANVRRLEFGLAERDEKLRNFNEELNNLKMESDQRDENISERLDSLKQREGVLEALQRATELRLEELREEHAEAVSKLTAEKARAETRASQLEQQIDQLKNESNSQNFDEVESLKAELSETCAKLEESQLEIGRLCTSIAELEHSAEESMSTLKAQLELTKGELENAILEADEARATTEQVEADSLSMMKDMQTVSEDLEKKINEYKQLVRTRDSELRNLKKEVHLKSFESERLRESQSTGLKAIEKLETALKAKAAECERAKSDIVKAQKQLTMLQQELGSSTKTQNELQGALNEMHLRLSKSEEQRDMLAGSLARQEEYQESVNKAREEMHQIALEDAADEIRSVRRKSTVLATALQQHVRINELDAEVALLVDEFAESMQATPQAALPTPTMTLNEPKTKPKTYRKTPAKPKGTNSSFITPVRPDASLKENIHKLNERADQISFNDLATKQPGSEANVYATPGDENQGARKIAGIEGKKALAPHSATKTRPALGAVSQNLA